MITLSFTLALVCLIIYLLRVYPKETDLEKGKVKMICMTLGMSSSIILGISIGLLLQGHFSLSTILAVIASFLYGFAIGKPFGSMAIAEGLSASFMGGMMGAMTGEMLPINDANLLLSFVDCIFVLNIAYVLYLIKGQKVAASGRKIKLKPSLPLLVAVIVTIVSIGSFNYLDGISNSEENHESDHEHMDY